METALTLPRYLETKNVIQKFADILGKNTSSFIASLLTIYNDDEKLKKCEPISILSAAKLAATMKLPIIRQLGYAYIIPYYDGRAKKYVAQFQIGYKGLLQLAMRTGVFRNINTVTVYEGQILSNDFITGEIVLGQRTSDEVEGYIAYIELTNGFHKTLYMTRAEVEEHARQYSQSYAYDVKTGSKSSVWTKNFDAMAKKTVLKKLLNTYAPTSIEMQGDPLSHLSTAIRADQAVISKDDFTYVDNSGEIVQRTDNNFPELSQEETDFDEMQGTVVDRETIDAETGEVTDGNK